MGDGGRVLERRGHRRALLLPVDAAPAERVRDVDRAIGDAVTRVVAIARLEAARLDAVRAIADIAVAHREQCAA